LAGALKLDRSGFILSNPVPTMPPAGLRSPSTIRRMVIAAVCQPLAANPLKMVRDADS
jgi:hypothetical protein